MSALSAGEPTGEPRGTRAFHRADRKRRRPGIWSPLRSQRIARPGQWCRSPVLRRSGANMRQGFSRTSAPAARPTDFNTSTGTPDFTAMRTAATSSARRIVIVVCLRRADSQSGWAASNAGERSQDIHRCPVASPRESYPSRVQPVFLRVAPRAGALASPGQPQCSNSRSGPLIGGMRHRPA